MLSLYTNAASLSTLSAMNSTQKDLATSMQRLGTGQRINSAMDDAAGLQIATRLNAQVSGMKVAMRNTQNDTSMLQTAEGALGEATNILTRMKDLATQASDASSSASDQTAMQAEYNALGDQLTNIMKNTQFGGKALLDKTTGTFSASVTFQVGASASEKMTFDSSTEVTNVDTALKAASTNYNTPGTPGTELTTAAGANTAITNLSSALDAVGALRSKFGAAANSLDHVYNNLSNMVNNVSQAKGRIMDTDYATESANMTSKQMLMQASTTMLKQSNGMSSMAMALLQ